MNEIKKRVYEANLELVNRGLVIYTWGNVSEIDKNRELVYIKPRGIDYDKLEIEDISVVNLMGELVEGKLLPSVDLDIHLEIYKKFKSVCAVSHTHSCYATAFAQALKDIKCYGSTHGDHFFGRIPCLPYLSKEEVENNYEKNLGQQIVEYFSENSIDPMMMKAVLAGGHGPFTWGENADEAVEYSVILEEVAKISSITESLTLGSEIPKYMLDKHYLRKFGKDSYFYQSK